MVRVRQSLIHFLYPFPLAIRRVSPATPQQSSPEPVVIPIEDPDKTIHVSSFPVLSQYHALKLIDKGDTM